MRAQLIANLTRKICSQSLTDSEFALPTLHAAEDVVLSFRLAKDFDGTPQIVSRIVHGLKVSLGAPDARPTAGTLKLKVGSGSVSAGVNTTAAISYNDTAEALATKLNALSGGFSAGQKPVTCELQSGSWIVRAANGSQLTLSVVDNTLQPLSRLMQGRTQIDDGTWSHSLRLTQYPIAFQDEYARLLPVAPTVTVTRAGVTNEGLKINQTVEIDFSAGFRGSYYLGLMDRQTKELQVENASGAKVDGPVQLQDALNAVGAPDGGEFLVTVPRDNVAKIEYIGAYSGTSFSAPSFHVVSAPEGDLTTTLNLKKDLFNRYVAARLAAAPTAPVTAQLQISVKLGSETDDEVLEWHTLWRTQVELEPNQNTDDLETIPNVSWLRGPDARDYTPRSTDSIASGSQHQHETFGDGTAVEFDWDHALDSDDLIFSLRENAGGGRLLTYGTDYEVEFVDSNNLVVTMLGSYASPPPATGALRASVVTADQRSVFLAHTHTIGDIDGLQAMLDAQAAAITALNGLIGAGSFGVPTVGVTDKITTVSRTLNSLVQLFGARQSLVITPSTEFVDYGQKELSRRGGGLFAAVHASSATALPVDLTVGGTPSTLYQNQTGGTVTLPGGQRHKSVELANNAYAAWSGEMWYQVAKQLSSEKTYYPTDFDRELVPEVWVGANQFPLGFELSLRIGLEIRSMRADISSRYTLIIEHGSYGSDSSPATTGTNLGAITWSDIPILEQEIVISDESLKAIFGCRLQNKTGGIVGKGIAYGLESSAGSVPSSNRFAIRIRLVRFDTANGKPTARGFIALRGLAVPADGAASDDTLGKIIIKQI